MKRALTLFAAVLGAAAGLFAQSASINKTAAVDSSANKFEAETKLAKLAVEAHGGEKLRAMKTLVMSGSVNVTTSAIAQAIPATFITIFAGDKYRIEIANPIQPLKQVFDGTQTSSTIRGGFTLPPINRLGFPLLQQLGKQGL